VLVMGTANQHAFVAKREIANPLVSVVELRIWNSIYHREELFVWAEVMATMSQHVFVMK